MRKVILLLSLVSIALMLGCTQIGEENATNKTSDNGTIIPPTECTTDSDCATGGCSGQVCTTKGKAKGIVTTCEYKEIYGCYDLTSCSCIEGKCQWKETQEFNSCINQYTN